MPSAERRLDDSVRRTLLELAARSVTHGLEHGTPLPVEAAAYPEPLCAPGASFVTLRIMGDLRGCIGSLEHRRPLVVDITDNAFAAAFRDPRFAPVRSAEVSDIDIHIAVLGPAEPLTYADEADLIDCLRPEIDGLILRAGHRHGTFLPSVWDALPRPQDFLYHLKRKAGLPGDYWSDDVRVWRYETESFPDDH
ncbi:MAG: AmmeMemoRadiSam system protein A [Gammaproteobacteria bacterium]|nr:AmmeMemoRadiSam system protein A [Gammaproteobacteria bacterium]